MAFSRCDKRLTVASAQRRGIFEVLAALILTFRGRELTRVPITRVTTTIGRDVDVDLNIDNVGVSRVHAHIRFNGTSFVISDADSQNGITVNGEPVRMMALAEGDVIGINKFLVHFSEAGGLAREQLEARVAATARAPRDVLETINLDPAAAASIAETARREIDEQRALRTTAGALAAGQSIAAPDRVVSHRPQDGPFASGRPQPGPFASGRPQAGPFVSSRPQPGPFVSRPPALSLVPGEPTRPSGVGWIVAILVGVALLALAVVLSR